MTINGSKPRAGGETSLSVKSNGGGTKAMPGQKSGSSSGVTPMPAQKRGDGKPASPKIK